MSVHRTLAVAFLGVVTSCAHIQEALEAAGEAARADAGWVEVPLRADTLAIAGWRALPDGRLSHRGQVLSMADPFPTWRTYPSGGETRPWLLISPRSPSGRWAVMGLAEDGWYGDFVADLERRQIIRITGEYESYKSTSFAPWAQWSRDESFVIVQLVGEGRGSLVRIDLERAVGTGMSADQSAQALSSRDAIHDFGDWMQLQYRLDTFRWNPDERGFTVQTGDGRLIEVNATTMKARVVPNR